MQKIKLVAIKKHEEKLLEALQKKGVMEITKIPDEQSGREEAVKRENLHDLELNIANLDFAIRLLKPYEKKRSIFKGPLFFTEEEIEKRAKEYKFKETVEKCQETEAEITQNRNLLNSLEMEESELLPWKNLNYRLDQTGETEGCKVLLGIVPLTDYEEFKNEYEALSLLQNIEKAAETESLVYVVLIFSREMEDDIKELLVKFKVSIPDLKKAENTPREELENIAKKRSRAEKNIQSLETRLKNLAKESENLKIAHDYYIWRRDSEEALGNFKNTEYSFAATGWVPLRSLEKLEKELGKITKDFEIFRIEKEEGEEEPVILRNRGILWPFETVTKIYGLPLPREVDPTPFLAAFFIIFFALCLTDAGYGLILFVLTFAALKWLKIPRQSQGLIKLIMIGGIITFIAGIFFGGWFGMTAEQAPSFLTYENTLGSGEVVREFKWQLINPSKGTGPLMFLIVAGILGVIQVLFGIVIDGYWKLRHGKYLDALLDSFLWLYFLISIILFGLSKTGIFLPEHGQTFTYMVLIGAGLMILTQGRRQKNIVLKFLSGVLSLYGLVGYLADVLSYSRLMALGLGTGIIGFAMNTMAGLVSGVPYIGIVFAVIVILIGHTLNIAISTLGAFIHSSRLQFVEFFGKFMEGGGREFRPFRKNCKYVYIIEK